MYMNVQKKESIRRKVAISKEYLLINNSVLFGDVFIVSLGNSEKKSKNISTSKFYSLRIITFDFFFYILVLIIT